MSHSDLERRPLAALSHRGRPRRLARRAALLVLGCAAPAGAQVAPAPPVLETALELRDGSVLRYAIALPAPGVADGGAPRPLVLALHPGGVRTEYYGSSFMQSIVEPALRSWGSVIVAPDVPDRSWATERAERAVLELVEHVLGGHDIDRARILVTGFSMGGRGAWYLLSRHADLFTGALVVAGSPGDTDLERLPELPIQLLHSPNDEVVPFGPVEEAYVALAARGYPIELRVLPGLSHYAMGAYVPALRVAGIWMLERWEERAARP